MKKSTAKTKASKTTKPKFLYVATVHCKSEHVKSQEVFGVFSSIKQAKAAFFGDDHHNHEFFTQNGTEVNMDGFETLQFESIFNTKKFVISKIQADVGYQLGVGGTTSVVRFS